MPLTDAQWDELLAQIDRAGEKPETFKPLAVDEKQSWFADFVDYINRQIAAIF